MIKNLTKKKKAFTLVEVIIVLAIIAIIAAIAIPNLTKVRTESKIKADTQSAESIKRTVVALITEDTIKVPTETTEYTMVFDSSNGKFSSVDDFTLSNVAQGEGKDQAYVEEYFNDITAPQADGKTTYTIEIVGSGDTSGAVPGEVSVETE